MGKMLAVQHRGEMSKYHSSQTIHLSMLTEGNPELEPGHTTIIHTVLHLVQLVRGCISRCTDAEWGIH
jgi:hypothetical protein